MSIEIKLLIWAVIFIVYIFIGSFITAVMEIDYADDPLGYATVLAAWPLLPLVVIIVVVYALGDIVGKKVRRGFTRE